MREPLARFRLRRAGHLDDRREPTPAGRTAALRMARDQALWDRYLEDYPDEAFRLDGWASRPIGEVLGSGMVAELERRLGERAPCA